MMKPIKLPDLSNTIQQITDAMDSPPRTGHGPSSMKVAVKTKTEPEPKINDYLKRVKLISPNSS